MNGLKALVIFLGVLIVLGLGVLAYGISVRLGGVASGAGRGAEGVRWAEDRVTELGAAARVGEMRVAGERLVVAVAEGEVLYHYVFDLARGVLLGRIVWQREGS